MRGINQSRELKVKARDTLFAAVVGVAAALGPVIAVGVTAAAVTILSSSTADAWSCGSKHRPKAEDLYCNTKKSPPAKRKTDGTSGDFHHPRHHHGKKGRKHKKHHK